MATLIVWDESLSINNEGIDKQHKELIDHLNKLTAAVNAHEGPTVILSTFDFLNDYTNFHFSTEEKFMVEHNYPGYNQHKTAHEEFINTLKNLEQDFVEEGATYSLADSLDTMLINWLINHIKSMDKGFGLFIEKHGINLNENM